MVKYKEKFQQFNINPNKGAPCFNKFKTITETGEVIGEDLIVINLAACFIKKNNFVKFISTVKEACEFSNKVNFTNLASLCYKWDILYGSEECFDFVRTVRDIVKRDHPDIELVQNGIYNLGETDMQPIDSLIKWDPENNNIYVNNVLVECLKYLGFVSSQIYNILKTTTNLNKLIPCDLIERLPLVDDRTLQAYEKIKEILKS